MRDFLYMIREEFEKLVTEALDELPEHIRQKMDNVAVVVEESPTSEQIKKGKIGKDGLLLGLYEGVPQTRRGLGYNLVLPDKITIFRRPIEQIARTPKEIQDQVRNTVWHEVAHYFGFDDEDIQKLAKNRFRKKRV